MLSTLIKVFCLLKKIWIKLCKFAAAVGPIISFHATDFLKEIKSLIFKRFCRYNEDSGTILCENFENYASLEFSSFEKSIKNIILNPLKNQILDDNLQFGKLDVKSNYEVKLSRVVQIDILSNPFASINASINNLLLFSDSIFEIIYENNKIDSNMCSNLAQNEIF